MATRNDVTGDLVFNKKVNDAYRNNYDAIFRKNKSQESQPESEQKDDQKEESSE